MMPLTFPPPDVEWTSRERLAWTPPDDLTVSQWADRFRILHPLTSAEAGPWRTSRTPYLRGIMDSASDPSVERITICASSQVGKTECLLNVVAYGIDQSPGSMLIVLPREDDAVSLGNRRIRPMLEASPRLARHLSEAKGDNLKKEIRCGARSILYLAGSNSPADLASRPIRYLIMDEVDKFPRFSGREADPVSLATERTRTFWNRKIIMASTPTTRDGYIWREWEASDRRLFFVPCPSCSAYQPMEFASVKFPEDERDPKVIRDERLAWYECSACAAKIVDREKTEMMARGVWAPEGAAVDRDGCFEEPGPTSHRGFRLNALYSPWLTFSEVAAKFLETKDDPALLMNFVNSWLGYVFEDKTEGTSVEEVSSRAAEYKERTVPDRAIVLTAGCDLQLDHLYYTVRAHGPFEESWLVECGRIDGGLESLVDVLIRRVWDGTDGRKHRLRLLCIDSGFRTDEVYQFARSFSEVVRPIKGQQRISGVPIRSNRIDKSIAGDPMRRSIRLWHIDTTHFKDKLARMMQARGGEHGEWHLPSQPNVEYLRQVTSEQKVYKRNRNTGATVSVWETKPGQRANHYLDCEVYSLVAAEMLSVFALDETHLASWGGGEPRREEPDRKDGGWMGKHGGGWMRRG